MFWFMEGTCFLPTFLVIWSSTTFLISYIIAILKGHVDVIFPFISDTGAEPPESGVFSLMTTITVFASVATMFARFKYVQKLQEVDANARPWLNLAAFWCGLMSCLGMCIVGTFQVTLLPSPHDGGAIAFFVFGVTYMILQSVISYRMRPYGPSMTVCHARAFISALALLVAFPMIVCAVVVDVNSDPTRDPMNLHWHTDDKNYVPHVVSTVFEWIVTFSFVFFFLTYIREFQRFKLTLTAEIIASGGPSGPARPSLLA